MIKKVKELRVETNIHIKYNFFFIIFQFSAFTSFFDFFDPPILPDNPEDPTYADINASLFMVLNICCFP